MFRSEFIPLREAFRVSYDADGSTKTKLLSIEEYVEFLEEVLSHSEAKPKLRSFTPTPKEFLSAKVDVEKWSGDLAYLLPSGVYPVLTKEDGQAMVRFPETLWCITVRRGVVSSMRIYCIFEPLAENTVLYRLPLPNVYDDGRICIGGNHWKFKDFSDFEDLVGRFFSAPHNGDLYQNYEATYKKSFKTLLQELKKDGITKERCVPVKEFGKAKLAAFAK